MVEVTLSQNSCVDGGHLGALGICFPRLTHLRVMQGWGGREDKCCHLPWDGGRVFTNLTHLHYEGDLLIGKFGRLQVRERERERER